MRTSRFSLSPAASAVKSVLLASVMTAAAMSAHAETATETGSSYDNYVNFGAFYLEADKSRGADGTSIGYNAGVGHRLNTNLWVGHTKTSKIFYLPVYWVWCWAACWRNSAWPAACAR